MLGIFRRGREEVKRHTVEPESIAEFWGVSRRDAALIGECSSLEEAGRKLLMSGAISEEGYLKRMGELYGLPFVLLEEDEVNGSAEVGIDPQLMRSRRVFPFRVEDGAICLAMADPRDLYTVELISRSTGKEVKVFISTEERIESAINRLFGVNREGTDISLDENVESLIDMASEAPVIRLVNMLISRAVEMGASDIHIEPFEEGVRVRYRVDGVLREVENLPRSLLPAVVSRVKIMARLDIANRRVPQDGRIKTKVGGKEIDIRVATLPTIYGEQVVMRLLDQESEDWDVDRIGFSEEDKKTFLELISSSHGMILVTGPTGSGKTTTLYSALKVLNRPEVKIITVEDPVEYVIQGVVQIQVNPQAGLTFASGLRSIVRQDPDVIMVGEIRDKETADIAIHAALTGHLVLSTLHTNDAASAATRLIDMGVEGFLVASALIGVVAQRLVRKVCPNCREEVRLPEEMAQKFGIDGPVYRGRGCDTCRGTGYLGRTAIYEILVVDDRIRRAIVSSADSEAIKRMALERGMKTLLENGIEKVKEGITTLEEVLRVAYRA